jgi:adenosine deaminase
MESHWYPKTRNSCGEWNMAEVLPTNYETIRKDRIDGGVLIAVKNTLISQDLEINQTVRL